MKLTPEHEGIVGLTGVICAGKDYVTAKLGATAHSMAGPLYELSERILGLGREARYGSQGPALRLFWQTVGQWGKGINVPAPAGLLKAFPWFPRDLRDFQLRYGALYVTADFGKRQDYWLRQALQHTRHAHLVAGGLHILTNVRFGFEAEAVQNVWHVTATAQELARRQGLQNTPPAALLDMSEHYACELDRCLKEIENRTTPTPDLVDWLKDNGFPHHRGVIWNDAPELCPNPEYQIV